MAILNTLSYDEFTSLVNIKWDEAQKMLPAAMRDSGIFKIDYIPDNTGKFRRYSEVDRELYAKDKPEGGQAELLRTQIGYEKDMELVRRGGDIEITYEMRHYNKYRQVEAAILSLAETAVGRMELDLAHRITFASATSYTDMDGNTVSTTMGDGLALASTAHTVRGASTTYRTILANNPQLSKGALEAMEKMIVENSINQFGEKIACKHDILWTTDDPNTVNTARELLQSTAEISAPNGNVVNVYRGKYAHKILPLVATDANGAVDSTKAKYWGLCSSMDFNAYLGINEEPHMNAPQEGSNAENVATDTWRYASRVGYGITIVSARGFAISLGDGTA